MTGNDELKSYFSDRLPSYLGILRQMVEINSFTTNRPGVIQLGELTNAIFARLGFEAEVLQSTNPNFGCHLFLRRIGTGGRWIALVSHLDTVFPVEEEISNQFYFRTEGERVYGPGAVDIKGGTVVIYMVLEALQHFYPQVFDSLNWLVALDASEEVMSGDFGRALLDRLDQDTLACLVFEGGTPNPDKFPLVTARKGKANFHVQVEGRSAHAGNRHAHGANAIVQIAHTIQHIAELTAYSKQLTFNVGTVRGGSVVNRVPHFAEAEVEMRAFSPDIFGEGIEGIMALNNDSHISSSQDGYPCKVNISLLDQTAPWPRNPQTDALFDLWRSTGAELGIQVIPEERGGLSDGNLTWYSYPTLDGLGPVGNNAHCSERNPQGSKDQEYAVIPSFVSKALLSTLAIVRLVEN